MAFQLSPGVSITERDLTTIIPAVATTNAGFAGYFQWGPADQRVVVSDVSNLVQLYGTPNDDNFKHWFSAANFLGYGNNLQVVRVCHTGAANAGHTAGGASYLPNNESDFSGVANGTYGMFAARYPGSLGNSIAVEICGADAGVTSFETWTYAAEFDAKPSTSFYAENSLGLTQANDEFHLVVFDRLGKFTGAVNTVLERFPGLSLDPAALAQDGTSMYFKGKINAESKYIVALGSITSLNGTAFRMNGVTASGVSGWSGLGTWAYNSADYTASRYDTGSGSGNTGGVFRLEFAGGTGEYDSTGNRMFTEGYGYQLFADADTSNVSLLIGGPLTASTVNSLVTIANDRKDCVAFVSPENNNASVAEATKLSTAKAFRDAVGNSSYTVIDSGYKYQYDSYNDTYRYIPLNGDIAGLCARTDLTNDPWYSPAGFNRGIVRNAIRLAYNPNKTHRDELYSYGINPVVTLPGEGTLLYGDKTAQTKPSAFDRINVRRLFIVLEKAIATAAKYSLFEFNDAFTRSQFRTMVEPFLRDVQSRRGITDFLVKCDESNNTAEVIDSNRFVADIFVKPARSINFIQLNFIATKTGVSFTEVGG